MLTSFWTGLGGKLADQWIAAVLSPAFLFWAGGLAAAGRIDDLGRDFGGLDGVEQGAAVVGAFVAVTVSGVVARALSLGVLRLLEGYWPRPFEPLRRARTRAQARRLHTAAERWRELAAAERTRGLTPSEHHEYADLDRRRRDAPIREELLMATRLGNRLRAAETRPDDRYGLDAITCWPRLWLVIPQAAQDEVTAARRALDACAEVWLWAALFCGWGVLSWWTVPVGIVVAAGAYRAILAAAGVYAELVVACYDLHRTALYRALRWPVPGTPAEERTAGRELTRYLARGAAPAGLSFATAAEGEAVQAP